MKMERNEKLNGLRFVAFLVAILIVGSVFAESGRSNGSDDENGSEGSSIGTVNAVTSDKPTIIIGDGGTSVYRLEIDPERQVTEDGSAVYKIVFKDPHTKVVCDENTTDNIIVDCFPYNYELEFEARNGLKGEFSEIECFGSETGVCRINQIDDEFTIGAGETKVIQLTVTTDKKGTSPFAVFIKDNSGVVAVGKAVIIYLPNGIVPEPEETAFFIGKGFVLSENKNSGFLLDLKILNKDSVLSGKAKIGDRNFKIEGSVAELAVDGVDFGYTASVVEFDLFSIKTGEKVGSFKGQARQYTGFLLLEGKIKNFEGKTWTLTSMGKKKFEVREFDIDEGESVEVSVGEAVVVPSVATETSATTVAASIDESLKEAENEIYIKPVKITEKKVLWIFPTSKKVVEVEVVRGDEVFKKKITEYSYEKVEGYKVSVGSLENEESIEFDVEKA